MCPARPDHLILPSGKENTAWTRNHGNTVPTKLRETAHFNILSLTNSRLFLNHNYVNHKRRSGFFERVNT